MFSNQIILAREGARRLEGRLTRESRGYHPAGWYQGRWVRWSNVGTRVEAGYVLKVTQAGGAVNLEPRIEVRVGGFIWGQWHAAVFERSGS